MLRSYRVAFVTWIVGVVVYLGFSVIVVLPDRAHYAGEFFLLFLACVWFAYAPPGRSADARDEHPIVGTRGGARRGPGGADRRDGRDPAATPLSNRSRPTARSPKPRPVPASSATW